MSASTQQLTLILLALWTQLPAYATEPPASILDLSHWRLTLPEDTERAGQPDEISQPELHSFQDSRFFFVDMDEGGVVFRAPCGGSTTKGSSYPRCELREMTNGGHSRASWSTTREGYRTMTLVVSVRKTPPVKQHVVCAQIHDATDDLMMIRLEGTKLFIERNGVGDVMLTRDYKLGTPFRLRIAAGEGRVRVWYEGQPSMDWQVQRAGCYFKAGCYTQSNPSKGDQPESYGEVLIQRLEITDADPGDDQ